MHRAQFVEIVFRIFGALILVVAIAHLYATTLIQDHVLAAIANEKLRAFVAPGYLLDHILVGVFMLPMGFILIWSGRALDAGQRWAYVVNISFSLAILSTPFLIIGIMPPQSLQAPVFLSSAIAMAVIGALSCGVLWWARRDFR